MQAPPGLVLPQEISIPPTGAGPLAQAGQRPGAFCFVSQKVMAWQEAQPISFESAERSDARAGQKKVREAEMSKVPFMLIIGEKEAELDNVSVRKHHVGDMGVMETKNFVELINKEISKSISNFEH